MPKTIKELPAHSRHPRALRVLFIAVILFFSFSVRGFTAYFVNAHLTDPAWFQFGSYKIFDRQAQDILDRKSSLFWIDNPEQTESAIYPPGYPLWIAFIYSVTGNRSAASVQVVQWMLDALSVLLIAGIGSTAYNFRIGLVAGLLAAFSPLLALSGATPLADAPTSWLVFTGVWLFVIAAKRDKWLLALFAGALVGLSCWFRANALLLPWFWIGALLLWQISWRSRVRLSAMILAGMLVVVLPLLIRNGVAFRVFMPTGLGAGTNLWEGIGETDRAAEFGAVYGDQNLLEKERIELGIPKDDQGFSLYHPNGVHRDRERAAKALAVIRAHPVWYASVMLRRMKGVLKFAGKPLPYYGSSGINVTSSKCLPPQFQGLPGGLVTLLGMVQSVLRYLALPLMILGIVIAMLSDWRLALLVMSTILYYLIVGSALHTEIRYGLPMQALLFVFAGVAVMKVFRSTLQDNG